MIYKLSEIVGGGYSDYWRSKKRYVVCKGSRGSKKSKTTALWIIANTIKYPQANTLCVRRFGVTIRDSQFSDLQWACERLGVSAFFRFKTSPLEITYLPTGQKILFRGLDDAQKVTSISVSKGVLCWVWIEEAYQLDNEDEFNKLDMSIRGEMPEGCFKRIMLTFNPWSAQSWIKARFFDVPSDNVLAMTTTWRCNEWLGDDDKQLFLNMEKDNPRRARIESYGDWGIAEGLIYERTKMEDFNIKDIGGVGCYGLDFGYTDPNAFVACKVTDDKIYVFDEWYKTNVTNKDIADKIKDMGYASERIICDSAEPKSIAELRDYGIRAEPSRKGRDSVNHGIKLIQNYEIIVHPKCSEFWREVTNYCWAENREKPEHEFSHCMDALRYACASALKGRNFSFD